ncbi:hypothetical protein CHS0354_041370 [Potamilus streckersoni]|uniref:F-box domain-containing protein n=1 Tax=Potamilus streckersoni TaxID=2493646 RepID=A0AAE0TA42_9BIVA|nr:hypothetical protein CHS0354_041370 [Potamilus streckersoni]
MDPEHSFWEYLPDIAVIEVFKHLGDRDRVNMALVCKNWNRLLGTPCLWRSRHFDMAGYRAQIIGTRACKYAERFGSYLKRLTITCSHPSYHTCKYFQKAMEDMISRLQKAQLEEFEMERLELDRFWKYESPRERLINSFVRFFKTQKSLQYFDMSMGQFPVPGGCRILEAVAHGSGDKVSDMLIEDFFHSRLAVFQVRRYITSISKFTNIKYLALNYNCLSEDIVEIFSKNLAGKLEAVNIKVYRNDPHFHHISGYAWRLLKSACPRLRVAFWLESMGHSSEIIPILVKDIPVWDIHLWTGYDDDAEWHLAQTIDHITDSYGHIIVCEFTISANCLLLKQNLNRHTPNSHGNGFAPGTHLIILSINMEIHFECNLLNIIKS